MIVKNGVFRYMFVGKDYAASTHFYGTLLGLPVDHEWNYGGTDCGTVYIAGGGMVEVLGALPGSDYAVPQGGWLSMEVEDVDAAYQSLKVAGVSIMEEPKDYPWGHRIVKVLDPDGLIVWLFKAIEG